MTTPKPSGEYTGEERAALLAQFETSGMTLRAFAESIGLPHGTFSHWRWRQRRDAAACEAATPTGLTTAPPTFVPVTVTATPAPRPEAPFVPRFEVVVPAGYVVRVGDDFEPAALRRLLAALEGAPC